MRQQESPDVAPVTQALESPIGMEKYLYLTKSEWKNSWINGGKIPLNLSSTYRTMERRGIYTPDENLIYQSTHDIATLGKYINTNGNLANIGTLKVGKITDNGITVAEGIEASAREEDGLILSFCNIKSKAICRKLEKNACVKIFDIEILINIIDEQLGTKCIAKDCEYTSSHNRNHFLKFDDDSWQQEFRLFWDYKEKTEIFLPQGVGKGIKIT
ncbi:hypothetical protein QX776_13575 [Alteromonadaceae bacterium BrNp21-10]|nr:hypothetical protein [Alteromonadaceae bacterium BrNp21-10]